LIAACGLRIVGARTTTGFHLASFTNVRSLQDLLNAIEREAIRAEFPIDIAAYNEVGKNPSKPILCAGSLHAPICVFGRDLGKQEVAEGEPLIGSAGRLVRAGLFKRLVGEEPPIANRSLETVLEHALLTNTVPYKPPGNKAYAKLVKERFRPYIAELLVKHWMGTRVICLGSAAFDWFAPYGEPAAFRSFWDQGDGRYQSDLTRVLTSEGHSKTITLCPLPHPSPLNQRWYRRFPELLALRLESARLEIVAE
jgi:uracil-DNA glycosylase